MRIEITDFVLEHAEALRLSGGLIPYRSQEQDFDVVISNPPYFKISKADPRATAAVHCGSRPAEHLRSLHGGKRRASARAW